MSSWITEERAVEAFARNISNIESKEKATMHRIAELRNDMERLHDEKIRIADAAKREGLYVPALYIVASALGRGEVPTINSAGELYRKTKHEQLYPKVEDDDE